MVNQPMGSSRPVDQEAYERFLDQLDADFPKSQPDPLQQLEQLDRLHARADQLSKDLAVLKSQQGNGAERQSAPTGVAARASAARGDASQAQSRYMGSSRDVDMAAYQAILDEMDIAHAVAVDPNKELSELQYEAKQLGEVIVAPQEPDTAHGRDTHQTQTQAVSDGYLDFLDELDAAFASQDNPRDLLAEFQNLQEKIKRLEETVTSLRSPSHEHRQQNPVAGYVHDLQPGLRQHASSGVHGTPGARSSAQWSTHPPTAAAHLRSGSPQRGPAR